MKPQSVCRSLKAGADSRESRVREIRGIPRLRRLTPRRPKYAIIRGMTKGVCIRSRCLVAAGLGLAAFVGCVMKPTVPEPVRLLEVVAVSECPRPPQPEGLSGVTRLSGNRFLAIDDRGGRLWTLDVAFNATNANALASCTLPAHVALEGVRDGEGCAWDPLRKTVWVSDERGPSVSEHDLTTGRRLGELALTDDFRTIRPNRGPEGLTISPDGLTLWTCPEEAVEGDGPLASPTNGTLVRLHRYVRRSGHVAWRHAEEIPYQVDPLGGRDYGGKSCSGVSGLCALSDGTVLVLEREMSVKGFLPSFRLRLYEVRPGRPKRLLLDRNTGLAMYEGICLVEEAADGSSVRLLLVSDGGGLPTESLLLISCERKVYNTREHSPEKDKEDG